MYAGVPNILTPTYLYDGINAPHLASHADTSIQPVDTSLCCGSFDIQSRSHRAETGVWAGSRGFPDCLQSPNGGISFGICRNVEPNSPCRQNGAAYCQNLFRFEHKGFTVWPYRLS